MQVVGLLHDVVEDTPRSIQDVRDEFGETIAAMVQALTVVAVAPVSETASDTVWRSTIAWCAEALRGAINRGRTGQVPL